MYKDLADATEALKQKGYENTFQLDDDGITCKKLDQKYEVDSLSILETHEFSQGTDPGSEATIYAIEADSGIKGILIISFGKYIDPQKATLIDSLLNAKKD